MRQFGIVNSKLDLSSRTAFDGGTNPQSGSLGAHAIHRTNLNSFPAPSLPAHLAPLLRASFYSRVQQALVDSFALLFGVFFMITILLSVPLAIFLLFFASF
jgi:hypothetical protein